MLLENLFAYRFTSVILFFNKKHFRNISIPKYVFILKDKTLMPKFLHPQKNNSNLFPQIYLFLFNFPTFLLSFISLLHTPPLPPLPLLSFCQNHPLKLPFSTTQPTKLSKKRFSASKYPHNKLYTKQISTKSTHSRTPHREENRQKLLLFQPSKAGIPMILALHPGQFRKPPW